MVDSFPELAYFIVNTGAMWLLSKERNAIVRDEYKIDKDLPFDQKVDRIIDVVGSLAAKLSDFCKRQKPFPIEKTFEISEALSHFLNLDANFLRVYPKLSVAHSDLLIPDVVSARDYWFTTYYPLYHKAMPNPVLIKKFKMYFPNAKTDENAGSDHYKSEFLAAKSEMFRMTAFCQNLLIECQKSFRAKHPQYLQYLSSETKLANSTIDNAKAMSQMFGIELVTDVSHKKIPDYMASLNLGCYFTG